MSSLLGIIRKGNQTINLQDFKVALKATENNFSKEFIVVIDKQFRYQSITINQLDNNALPADELIGVICLRLSHSELDQNATQPSVANSDLPWVLFDGEIFALNGTDYDTTEPYSNFIAREFQLKQKSLWPQLNAQFTAILCDPREQLFQLIQDKHASHALFYLEHEEVFLFGNSARFVAAHPIYENNKVADWQGLWHNLSFPAPPQPLTCFNGIKSLERGKHITLKDGKLFIESYYQIPIGQQMARSKEEAGELIDYAMRKSIRRRTKGTPTIGAPISGGVDSPYIAALASEYINQMDVFTFSLADSQFSAMNEHERAGLTAKKYHLNHHIKYYSVADLTRDLQTIVPLYDQVGTSFAPYFYVIQQADEKNVPVLLSGLAADESHGGFHYFKYIPLWQKIQWFPWITHLLPRAYSAKIEDLKNLSVPQTIDEYYADAFSTIKEREKKKLFSSLEFDSLKAIRSIYNSTGISFSDNVEGLLYFMFANVPNHHLYRFKQFANYFGVKVRHPFLDDDVVEAAFQTPSNLIVSGDVRKIALKTAASKYLPSESLVKRKLGLTLPIGYWLNNELKDFKNHNLKELQQRDFIQSKEVEKLVQQYSKIKPAKIMKLIMLNQWFKQFID